MSKSIQSRPINEIVTENYYNYGSHVNTSRSIPYELDGLKPVYRRIIYTLYKMKDDYHKTISAIGEILKLHPHVDRSLKHPIAMLCHYGYCETKSNQGSLSIYGTNVISAGDPRYTNVKLSTKLRNLMKFAITDVKMLDSDTGYPEPESIPFPVPIILTMDKMSGMGVGVSSTYPTFSMESMLEAYHKDDPSLLKHRANVHIDYSRSDLKSLWENGRGKVTYYPDVYIQNRSVFVECSPGLILFPYNWDNTTQVGRTFNELRDQGKILINDLSDSTHEGLLEVSISKGIKTVDIDWLYDVIKKQVEDSFTYTLFTSTGDFIHKLSLRDWIHKSYTNYCDLVKKGLTRRIGEVQWDKKIYNELPRVGECLLEDRNQTNEQIAKKLSLDVNIVKECVSKPIGLIRKSDHSAKIQELDKKIKELKSITPESIISDNII